MDKIYYNKLIRDNIPEKIFRKGSTCHVEELTDRFFEHELLKKVSEEASALPVVLSREELVAELADVLDVIDAIKKFKHISTEELNRKQHQNLVEKGGFNKRLYLVWSSDDGYVTNEVPYRPEASYIPPLNE